jgi:hypothetical protein
MYPHFKNNDRRKMVARRKNALTIHFSERRSGKERRILLDRRQSPSTKRENGKERRNILKSE